MIHDLQILWSMWCGERSSTTVLKCVFLVDYYFYLYLSYEKDIQFFVEVFITRKKRIYHGSHTYVWRIYIEPPCPPIL